MNFRNHILLISLFTGGEASSIDELIPMMTGNGTLLADSGISATMPETIGSGSNDSPTFTYPRIDMAGLSEKLYELLREASVAPLSSNSIATLGELLERIEKLHSRAQNPLLQHLVDAAKQLSTWTIANQVPAIESLKSLLQTAEMAIDKAQMRVLGTSLREHILKHRILEDQLYSLHPDQVRLLKQIFRLDYIHEKALRQVLGNTKLPSDLHTDLNDNVFQNDPVVQFSRGFFGDNLVDKEDFAINGICSEKGYDLLCFAAIRSLSNGKKHDEAVLYAPFNSFQVHNDRDKLLKELQIGLIQFLGSKSPASAANDSYIYHVTMGIITGAQRRYFGVPFLCAAQLMKMNSNPAAEVDILNCRKDAEATLIEYGQHYLEVLDFAKKYLTNHGYVAVKRIYDEIAKNVLPGLSTQVEDIDPERFMIHGSEPSQPLPMNVDTSIRADSIEMPNINSAGKSANDAKSTTGLENYSSVIRKNYILRYLPIVLFVISAIFGGLGAIFYFRAK